MVLWNILKKNRIPLLYSLIFAFVCYLSYCFPLMGDDLSFTLIQAGSFSELFDFALNYGNGRYIGNFLVIPLVNGTLFRVLMKSSFFFLTFWLIKKLFTNNRFRDIFSVFILILGMPISIFRQAFVWSAGFQNYFPPVALMLICLYLIKRYDETKKAWLLVLLAPLAFAAQLFVENSTAFHVVVAVFLLVYFIRKKKNLLSTVVYSVFSAVGAVLMLLHPKSELVENYRTHYFKDIPTFFSGLFENYKCIADTLRQGFFLWILLSLICFSLLESNRERIKGRYSVIALKAVLGFFPAYCASELFFLGEVYADNNVIRNLCGLLLPLVYSFCVVFTVCMCMPNSKKKTYVIGLFAAGLCALAIIMPVFPIDSRCVYLAYICFCAAALVLYSNVEIRFNLQRTSVYTMVALSFCYGFVYSDICYANNARENYIAEKKSEHAEMIVIPDLPHSQFLHFNFDRVYFIDYYYYYYETPGDLQFITTDWDKWLTYVEEEG